MSWFATIAETLLLVPLAFIAARLSRLGVRRFIRRAARRAQRADGSWRVRLDRLDDDGQGDVRKRQRADSVARIAGHVMTVAIFAVAALVALDRLGVDLVVAISSAGFIGFAIALSGQDLIKDCIAGARVLLEDRYAVGDEVVVQLAGTEVRGAVDLIGAASVRLRTPDGATWHAGHHSIESVTNRSQLPTISHIAVPVDEWARADATTAGDRLAGSSNDIGLTGVVFMRDIETHRPAAGPDGGPTSGDADGDAPDTVTVQVKANRPLSAPETELVRARLLEG